MNNAKEQSAGKSSTKPSFQSKSLGPNKLAPVETPATTPPEAKPDVKLEVPAVAPEAAPQVTAKHPESNPILGNKS